MIIIKALFVAIVLFELWNSSGAAPSNSVDRCINNSCGEHTSCHNGSVTYTCICHPGFKTNGSYYCRESFDLAEDSQQTNTIVPPASAEDASDEAPPTSDDDDEMSSDDETPPASTPRQADINECFVNGQHVDEEICGQHAKCTNTLGSFECTCNAGYYREAFQCYATASRRDCADIRALGHTTSGVYTLYIGESQRTLDVYCDMTTGSVGWTVFQRRQDGSVDFHLNWVDYQKGFGDIREEFWIGNDNLHLLTSNKRYKLRVELTAFDGTTAFAEFDDFKVASAADKYKLTSIGKYSGTAGDSLWSHVGMRFSTKDQDNDQWSSVNCAAESRKGAWWYENCAQSNLNGFYYKTHTNSEDSVCWQNWKKNHMSLKRTEMKLTPFV